MDKTEMPCQALVRMLAKKPGWKETNFQVTISVSVAETDSLFPGEMWQQLLELGINKLKCQDSLCRSTL